MAVVAPNAIASSNGSPKTVLNMVEPDSDSTSSEDVPMKDTTAEPRVAPDTHEELMYTLGINLARQLGDIRPLVENGEELAQVAKGLLDAVVGRLEEPQQLALLSKRGKELDALIVERAYVSCIIVEALFCVLK